MPDGNQAAIGQPALRIDGRAKVTGRARYASDEVAAKPARAFLVTSAIAPAGSAASAWTRRPPFTACSAS